VAAMNGRIWVESDPGKGSTFHFTAQLEPAPEGIHTAPNRDAALDGIRVLVVDDNNTNRRILMDMLSIWGMQPTQAASAPEALACMRDGIERHQPFQLVLTDVHMPDMDGFDLVERIVGTPTLTNAFILMLTSGEHLGDLARCRKLGISTFLTKPIRRAELRAAIANTLAADRGRGSRTAQDLRTLSDRTAKRASSGSAAASGAHILLAEDNVVNQRVARAMLEKAGHTIVIAHSGQSAVTLWEKEPFDLILMDVQMPDMDGFEATAAIRAREKISGAHIPIVAMTAHAMSEDRERCLVAGMDHYISKPIHGPALLDLVAACLNTPSKAL
jgi:two-component system sensor histidine kinase/response regulator